MKRLMVFLIIYFFRTVNNENVCELSPAKAYSNPNYSNVVLAALNKQRLQRKVSTKIIQPVGVESNM